MNLIPPNPALPPPNPTHEQCSSPLRTLRNLTRSTQQTLWRYLSTTPTETTTDITNENGNQQTPPATVNTQSSHATPASTPIHHDVSTTQNSEMMTNAPQPPIHQLPLRSERSNDPWGDSWAMEKPTSMFRIISKNTGTINLSNLDMQAITKELNNVHASVFAAQETNVNWNVDSMYQLVTQCRQTSPQIKIATSTSAEKSSEWHKPGGTLLMAINQWTSRVTKYGNDAYLGRWTYMEFIGKNDKRLIVISGYHVCNQQFDAVSNTMTAQQIRLLQARGIARPKPRKVFLDDIIQQIQTWRNTHHKIILCMDANKNIDDPRSDVA